MMRVAAPQEGAKPPTARKWFKQWVPCDTALNPGKCSLLKWVNDDIVKSLKDKCPEVENEPEEEYEVLYLCTFEGCAKAFADQSALRKHSNVHGEKQFICHYEGCGKRFMDSSKLKRHFLIHTGERHFVCPIEGCGKAFSLDFNLRSHMRTHTQENYHVCPFEDCGKRYAHEYKLRAHLRTCHDKVLPPDVRLAPPLPAALEKEIRVQKMAAAPSVSTNLERPFACHHEGCDKRYIHEYKLNLHLRKEHANDNNVGQAARSGRHADWENYAEDGHRSSGHGKARAPAKPSTPKNVKPARSAMVRVDLNMKVPGISRPGVRKEVPKKEIHADSEETEEEEDSESTEDEDMGRTTDRGMLYEDDEETEDDME